MALIDIYALGMLVNVGIAVLTFFYVIICLLSTKENHPTGFATIMYNSEKIKEIRGELIELRVSRFRISLITSRAWIIMFIPFSAILDQAIMFYERRTKSFHEIIISNQDKQIRQLNQLAIDCKNKASKDNK